MKWKSRLLAASLCLAAVAYAHAGQLKVATWNMEWFPGGKPSATAEERADQIGRAKLELLRLQPDVLLVQEITDKAALEETLGVVSNLQLCVLSAFETGGHGGKVQQVGIASKYPAYNAWAEEWKKVGGNAEPPRGFAYAAISVATDAVVMAYSLHLKSNAGGPPQLNIAKREESARQLLVHIGEIETKLKKDKRVAGIFFGGDMNTNAENPQWAAEKTLRVFSDAGFANCWRDIPAAQRQTWLGNERFEPCTFDWLFYQRLGKQTATVVPSDRKVSDHAPIVVFLDLP